MSTNHCDTYATKVADHNNQAPTLIGCPSF